MMAVLDILVPDKGGIETTRPVTGGVPVARGAAPAGSRFTLRDARGRSVPLQTRVLARWNDRSIRWLLLDFQAVPPRGGTARFRLSLRKKGSDGIVSVPLLVRRGARPSLVAGNTVVAVGEQDLLRIGKQRRINLILVDAKGCRCRAIAETAEVESKAQ